MAARKRAAQLEVASLTGGAPGQPTGPSGRRLRTAPAASPQRQLAHAAAMAQMEQEMAMASRRLEGLEGEVDALMSSAQPEVT